MIEISGLDKYYGPVQAVKSLDLQIGKGEVFGLLGPNGSGKSTVIRTMVGLLNPDRGRLRIAGYDLRTEGLEARRRIAYIPQRITMPENLTGREIVRCFARLRGLAGQPETRLLEIMGLQPHADKRIRQYSGGMLQRLGLAVAFLGQAPVLIMDEPTLNLDPAGMRLLRNLIQERKKQGATILFASHILADAETLADRVGIMVAGELLRTDSVENLHREIQKHTAVTVKIDTRNEELLATARRSGARQAWYENGDLRFLAPVEKRLAVLEALEKSGVSINQFATEVPRLDQLLMEHLHAKG